MTEESTLSATETGKPLTMGKKQSQLFLLIAPSTVISFIMFVALIGMTLFCFDWKRDSMLSHSLRESLEFDEVGRCNLLLKGQRALTHGYYYTAERIFNHTIGLLEDLKRDQPASDTARQYSMNIAGCKNGLAQVKLESDKLPEAAALVAQALDLCSKNKDEASDIYANVLTTEAETELAQGKSEDAQRHFDQAQLLMKKAGQAEDAEAGLKRFQAAQKKYSKK